MIRSKRIKLICLFALLDVGCVVGQGAPDTLAKSGSVAAGDDPSQFISRMELFNELQHYKNETSHFYVNQTTLRSVVKIGKRFTTRLDVPFVYNSFPAMTNTDKFGLGDISFRLLGYKFMEANRSAFTASIEVSLNTAQTRFQGTGKNIVLPVVTYTTTFPDKRWLMAFVFQEAISIGGDDSRQDVNFSKLQPILLRLWSRKLWTVVAPEIYLDHMQGGLSMNLEARMTFAPKRRINVWVQGGAGIFGDFMARYEWGTEAGCRYFLFRDGKVKSQRN